MSKKNKSNNKSISLPGNNAVAIKPKWQHILLIVVLVVVVYSNSLNNGYILDDNHNINNNDFIKDWKNFPKMFSSEYFVLAQELTYRPIVTLSYFVNYSLCGLNKACWRLINVFFHCINGILIYLLIILLFKSRKAALITSLLFCLHPIHAEIINIISFREDLISLFFFLLSFIFYIKHVEIASKKILYYICSLCFFFLAVFTKEMALTLPFVLILYEFYFNEKRALKTSNFMLRIIKSPYYWGYYSVIILFFIQRIYLLKPFGYIMGKNASASVEYTGGSAVIMMLNMIKAIVFCYIKTLLFPFKFFIGYLFPFSLSIDFEIIISAMVIISLVILAIRINKYWKEVSFSIFYFFICLVPVMNIIPTGAITAERYLYFSSIGFCSLLGLVIIKISDLKIKRTKLLRTTSIVIAIAILVFYSVKIYIRNTDFKDEATFWARYIDTKQNSLGSLHARGNYYIQKKYYKKAIVDFSKAIELAPEFILSYSNRGIVYHYMGNYDKAIADFNKIIELNPNNADAYCRRGIAYGTRGNTDRKIRDFNKAIADFTKAIELAPEFILAYSNRGIAYYYTGNYDKAIADFNKIIELDSKNPKAYKNRANAYRELGKPNLAKRDEEKAKALQAQQ